MTLLEGTLLAAAALIGTGLSALFSGMETGLYTMNRVRLELRSGDGFRPARRLLRLIERPQRMLAVVLIGNNAANQLGAWSIAAMLHAAGLSAVPAIIVDTLILVPVLLIFAEVLPKDLFRAHGDRWCYALAGPLRAVDVVLATCGLSILVEWFGRGIAWMIGGDAAGERSARQRMSDLLKEGVGAGVLSTRQTALLDRALRLRERSVAEVMIPWGQVATLDASADAAARQRAIDSRWTRLPTTDANGRVLGITSVLDLASALPSPLDAVIKPALHVSSGDRADNTLRALRKHDAAVAIVSDDRGRPIGIVTVKDLVRPLLQ